MPLTSTADVDDDAPVTVLYVGGFGRSGSTVLSLLLGQHPRAVSVGELVHVWERGLRDNERCGCGQPFLSCPFWSEVGRRAVGGWDKLDPDEVLAWKRTVDRNRHIPRLLRPGGEFGRDLARYGELLTRVYRAITETAGVDVVVDTSKHASSAYLLRQLPELDLRVIHLVRDSRAVAHSWGRTKVRPEVVDGHELMPRYPAASSARMWMFYNGMLHGLSRLGVPVRGVRYEDLMDDPAGTVAELCGLAGLDPTELGDRIGSDSARLEVSHTVAGNPMRFASGEIELRSDDAWRREMPSRARRVVSILSAPLLWRYGYGLGGEPGPVPDRFRGPRGGALPVSWRGTPDPSDERPGVSVIVPTRDRPHLLRTAIDSIVAQRYAGEIEVVVVYDRTEPDESLAAEIVAGEGRRRVRVLVNENTPGLAGGRNTGIAAASHDLIAFCDDDDAWHPDKLRRQVEALEANPDAEFAVTGIVIEFEELEVPRLLDRERLGYLELIRARHPEAHPSGYLMRRSLLDAVGGIDETLPGSYAEDYDLVLKAARRHDVLVVDEPLVRILWGSTSFFAEGWRNRIGALSMVLDRFPEFTTEPRGRARITGQIAYAHAALGERRSAARMAMRTLRDHPGEKRALLALIVASGLVSSETVIRALQRTGRGI